MKIFLRKYGEIWMFPFFFFFNELKIIHDHEGKENIKINSSKLLSKLEIQIKMGEGIHPNQRVYNG